MAFTYSELLWLFLLYSFLGWILETITATVKNHYFTNRGLVNLPFCILYGSAAIFITTFTWELDGIWLYIGSVILATVFEWTAGHFIKKLYHERWWNYSDMRFHLDGYICLRMSAIWGVLSYIMMKLGNSFLLRFYHFLPKTLSYTVLLITSVLLILDIFATLVILNGRSKDIRRWIKVDIRFSKISSRLGEWIFTHVDTRIKKAYPQAKPSTITATSTLAVFAEDCNFHKLVWIFMISAFLGDIVETLYCRLTAGIWMSRSSVVFGPFSIVWGLAIAGATAFLHRYLNKSNGFLFTVGMLLGGAYEYVCSVFTEIVFGKVFWDYSTYPLNLGGRINLLYCFFWGIAAVVWMKFLYPKFSTLIEKVPIKPGKFITWVFVLFMSVNMLVSGMALIRSKERTHDIPAVKTWQKIMDEYYDDTVLQKIYPNALGR